MTEEDHSRIRLGISSCLLGEPVRYDGQHTLDRYLRDDLGAFVDYVPVCPEVEAGYGIPRESMRLVGPSDAPRLYTSRSHRDVTEPMISCIARILPRLETERLDGFVLKSKSPTSGMSRVRLYPTLDGMPSHQGGGLFAAAVMRHFPLLPVEEEGRLNDPVLRENFIERIFVMHRWNIWVSGAPDRRGLLDFHTRHKMLLLAHDPPTYRELGTWIATLAQRPLPETLDAYILRLMTALKKNATPARHVNTLQHIAGHFKKQLSDDERAEFQEILRKYRAGFVPLIVPITLLNHFVRKFSSDYLAQQFYLHPHPEELALRNHV